MGEPRDADWVLLDLAPGASREELERAYRRRRALYDAESLATYSLLSDEERQAFLDSLDAAYRRLQAACPTAAGPLRPVAAVAVAMGAEAPGLFLRRLREVQGVTLETIARRTKIRPAVLEALEREDWAALPAPVYVRGFVIQVARLLGEADPEGFAHRYLAHRAPQR